MINKDLLKTEAMALGIELSEQQLSRFDKYAELLVSWNEKINLTAITDPDEIVLKHFVDSLALLKYCEIPGGSKVIDVGTGAGFPGVVLLIANPTLDITLLDSTQKKLSVISNILENLGLSANIVHKRAEEAGHDDCFREKYDFATARAVANLRNLSEYCLPFVKVGGTFISMKGADAENELEIAENAIKALGGKLESFNKYELPSCGERAIIKISKVSSTNSKYPRPKAKMEKQPL